jgi:2'-5' RNA ligase
MRLFVALPVPAPARDEIERVLAELRREPWPVRWVNPDGIHLTLKFLGEVPTDAVASLTSALRAAGQSIRPLYCRTTSAGAFPSLARARVIWLGLEAPGGLELLADRIERSCETLGFPSEGNIFRPHLTLGRVQHNARLPREAVDRLEGLSLESSFTGEEFTLFESRPGPGGSAYRPLAEFSLVA